jgi:hypothetical protein
MSRRGATSIPWVGVVKKEMWWLVQTQKLPLHGRNAQTARRRRNATTVNTPL